MSTDSKLAEALRLIAWSNDSAWQAQCAREALAAHEAEQERAGEAVAVPNLDPDGDTSRAGFAAMDAELVARWMSPWQVWREAVRWSTGQRAIHGITKEPKT